MCLHRATRIWIFELDLIICTHVHRTAPARMCLGACSVRQNTRCESKHNFLTFGTTFISAPIDRNLLECMFLSLLHRSCCCCCCYSRGCCHGSTVVDNSNGRLIGNVCYCRASIRTALHTILGFRLNSCDHEHTHTTRESSQHAFVCNTTATMTRTCHTKNELEIRIWRERERKRLSRNWFQFKMNFARSQPMGSVEPCTDDKRHKIYFTKTAKTQMLLLLLCLVVGNAAGFRHPIFQFSNYSLANL